VNRGLGLASRRGFDSRDDLGVLVEQVKRVRAVDKLDRFVLREVERCCAVTLVVTSIPMEAPRSAMCRTDHAQPTRPRCSYIA